ncbi:hypothetical protein [Chlamydiifrater volucris]|uniref:hypothetical protein n=1 Tax=Chlamydiifrater volucris TaxID=2681470 RepID=UPI0032B1EA95
MTSGRPLIPSFNAFGFESWAKEPCSNIIGSIPVLGAVSGARRISRAVDAMKTFDNKRGYSRVDTMSGKINVMSHIFRGVLEIFGVGILASVYDLATLLISLVVVTVVNFVLGVLTIVGCILAAALCSLSFPLDFVAAGLHDLLACA